MQGRRNWNYEHLGSICDGLLCFLPQDEKRRLVSSFLESVHIIPRRNHRSIGVTPIDRWFLSYLYIDIVYSIVTFMNDLSVVTPSALCCKNCGLWFCRVQLPFSSVDGTVHSEVALRFIDGACASAR